MCYKHSLRIFEIPMADEEYLSSVFFASEGALLLGGRQNIQNAPFNRRFRSFFGTSPIICSSLWGLLAGSRPAYSQPKHLLWALMFLRLYNTEHIHARLAGVDEKTFRKWSWAFVREIAKIQLVCNIIFYLL